MRSSLLGAALSPPSLGRRRITARAETAAAFDDGDSWETKLRYDLQRLGALGFQDCIAALAIKALGATVRPMSPGPDGGRDLLANGVILWSAGERYDADSWDGTTVFQVKHKATLRRPDDGRHVAVGQIRDELNT